MFGNVRLKRRPRDHHADAGLQGHDAGRTQAAVQTELTDLLAGTVVAVGDLPVLCQVGAEGPQAPGQDDVNRVAPVTLVDQDNALSITMSQAAPGQPSQGRRQGIDEAVDVHDAGLVDHALVGLKGHELATHKFGIRAPA